MCGCKQFMHNVTSSVGILLVLAGKASLGCPLQLDMILLPPTDHFLPGPASLSKTTVCVPRPECLPCDVVCCVTPCSSSRSSLGTGMHLWQPSNRKRDMHNAFMKHKTRWASRRSHTGRHSSPQPIHYCLHVHHTGKLDFNLE